MNKTCLHLKIVNVTCMYILNLFLLYSFHEIINFCLFYALYMIYICLCFLERNSEYIFCICQYQPQVPTVSQHQYKIYAVNQSSLLLQYLGHTSYTIIFIRKFLNNLAISFLHNNESDMMCFNYSLLIYFKMTTTQIYYMFILLSEVS